MRNAAVPGYLIANFAYISDSPIERRLSVPRQVFLGDLHHCAYLNLRKADPVAFSAPSHGNNTGYCHQRGIQVNVAWYRSAAGASAIDAVVFGIVVILLGGVSL
jgi:hypothetical protein